MTTERTKFGNIHEADEPIRKAAWDAWQNGARTDWAALVGLKVTGEAEADDMGFDLFEELRGMSVDELFELRYSLRDHYFGPTLELSEDPEPGTRLALIRALVRILEAEIGGRWVGVRPSRG